MKCKLKKSRKENILRREGGISADIAAPIKNAGTKIEPHLKEIILRVKELDAEALEIATDALKKILPTIYRHAPSKKTFENLIYWMILRAESAEQINKIRSDLNGKNRHANF